MSIQISSNEGQVIRQANPPDVAANPRLKNFVWIREGNPPTLELFNNVTGVWSDNTAGTVLTKLDPPTFSPVSGAATDGFELTAPVTPSGVDVWYSINGSVFRQYTGGKIIVGTGECFYVSAYSTKIGYLNSDTMVVEYNV